MSQEEYENKLRSVHRFIPFLENMIIQLKDPKMKNREQQLSKMESLYQMITDKNKKLKLETLSKCEEVILKLFHKVKGENASLPPVPPTTSWKDEKRKPISLYSIAGESLNKPDIGAESSAMSRPKSFMSRKPPISYSDLECLEKDVAHELEKKMSMNELNSLRNQLCKELEDTKPDQINTTVRNKPVLTRMNAASPDKQRKKPETSPKIEPKKEALVPKKIDPKPAAPKVLKEAGDLFCNVFSEIDKTYEIGLKKKEEKKVNREKKDSLSDDSKEKVSLKQLSEKAALLRDIEKNTKTTKKPSATSLTSAPTLEDNVANAETDKNSMNNKETPLPVAQITETSTVITNTEKTDKGDGETFTIPLIIPSTERKNINRESAKIDDSENKEKKVEKQTVVNEELLLEDIPLPSEEKNKSNGFPEETNAKSDYASTKQKKIDNTEEPASKTSHKSRDDSKDSKEKKNFRSEISHKDKKHTESKKEKSHKSEHKKDKNDRSHKSDHKRDKDKDDKHREKGRDKDKKDREYDKVRKDKNVEKTSKPSDSKDKNIVDDHEKTTKENAKEKKDCEPSVILKKIHSELDTIKEQSNDNTGIDELSKKIDEVINANKTLPVIPLLCEKPGVPNEDQKGTEECKPVNRDPRLKFGAMTAVQKSNPEPGQRLAFKYNPKPKRQDAPTDIDRNVVDSIEKSMKESSVPLIPPAKLSAPPAPPNDLFSPESPDEIDKAAVPPIINDLLLNPKTTGVINEVVSALRRSNTENSVAQPGPANVRQPVTLHFSPPVHAHQYDPPQDSLFLQKQAMANQSLGFNPFSPQECSEVERPNYHAQRNQMHFEPPCQNQYDDIMGQSFYMDRPQGYAPPSSGYAMPSNYVPPSPSYVPCSPLYDGGGDNFRDANYQNFHSSNQRFFDSERPTVRPKGLLGDAPSRFAYNQQQFNSYSRFGGRGCNNAMDPRSGYYAAPSRDPRVNMNRGHQFQDPRPMMRESRMTYREYKEQKEREMREKEALEREQKEREEAEQKLMDDQQRNTSDASQKEKEVDKTQKTEEETEDEGSRFKHRRERARSPRRDRYQTHRSSSRYRRDRDDERSDRSRDKSRYDSKFDKVYSSREKDRDLSTPLNSIFAPQGGKGYGSQYKIPKKPKEEDKTKEENKTNDDHTSKEKSPKKELEREIKKDKNKNKSRDQENSTKEKKATVKHQTDVDEVKKEVQAEEVDKSLEKKPAVEEKTSEELEGEKIKNASPKKTEKQGCVTEKKEEEENILSKFFQNLMKSSNKDEKKGALLSLISTFSDSFSDQQLKKITSIIKSDDVEEESKEEKKFEAAKESEIETKGEGQEETVPEETQDTTEKEIEAHKEEEDEEETASIETAQCTTRSKIKSRRKSEVCKSKNKSELDRLHDDIREMFIRDGVVTATGKRMCRILKDSSGSPSTENERTEDEHVPEDDEKKVPVAKKKGRKPAQRKTTENPELPMKELSVVLPKISLENIKNSEAREKQEDETKDEEASVEQSEEEASDKEEVVEKTGTSKRGRVKKRNSWASGVIKKKSVSKSKKNKVPDVSEKAKDKEEADPETNQEKEGNPHDVKYYMAHGQKKLQCKFCDVSTKWIAAHYRSEHPDQEVLSARLPPIMAKHLIEDALENKETYENDTEESIVKHDYLCMFCDYKQTTLPKFFRDHVSIHTGEFRYTCPFCSFSRSHIKTMQQHVNEAHPDEEDDEKKPIMTVRAPNNRNIYAYICDACNYTQMSLENVKKHVATWHSGVCNIHKIKINQDEKLETVEEEEKASRPFLSERTTRRSAKFNRSYEEDAIPLSQTSETSNEDEVKAGEKPLAEKKSEKIAEDCESSTTEIEEESSTEPETPPITRRRTRKRTRTFSAPSPVKKRLRRRNIDTTTSPENDKKDNDGSKPKSVDEAVFTCNTDIQEENKRIEEERLKTMQDINSSIKLRTSLEFVEKLSHRLKQEEVVEEVEVKQEVEDIADDVLEKLPVSDLPVFEKSAIQKAEVAQLRQEASAKAAKDIGRVNPVNGVIEKLQGILGNNPPTSCDDAVSPYASNEESSPPPEDPAEELVASETPIKESDPLRPDEDTGAPALPPLTHMNNLEKAAEKSSLINSETLNIGYVKVMKTSSTYIYVCCVPPCIFSSRDRTAFASHCQLNHHFSEDSPRSTQCLECGSTITSSEECNILSSTLNHVVDVHSDFLGVKIGSIRISSNLFPKKDEEGAEDGANEDPSTPPTISIPSPPPGDVDCLLAHEEMQDEEELDNPFAFKIVNVVSLADEDAPFSVCDDNVEGRIGDKEPETSQAQESTSAHPTWSLSSLFSKYQTIQRQMAERKSPTAMKKFLGNHFDLYKCPDYQCLFTTNKRKMFEIHLKMHTKHKKNTNCLYCDKVIPFEATGFHYEKMHGVCRFSCSFCLYRCIAKDYMDIHQLLAHPDMPSRMQLLPKRDSEEKNSLILLAKNTKHESAVVPYSCCDRTFTSLQTFTEHLQGCSKNPGLCCFYPISSQLRCMAAHGSAKELVAHWGDAHQVYPLRCAYCSVGDFDLNFLMVHLVLQHPTQLPDIIDRRTGPAMASSKEKPYTSVKCNFQQLLRDLKSAVKPSPNTSRETVPTEQPQPVQPAKPQTPPTMQKVFEQFALKSHPSAPQKLATYSKMTPMNAIKKSPPLNVIQKSPPLNVIQKSPPLNLIQKSPPLNVIQKSPPVSIIQNSPPSVALLKPASKASVLNASGVVYCLSTGAPAGQSPVLKAIVVNKDQVPQQVKLVSPIAAGKEGNFQIVGNLRPLAAALPKLMPLKAGKAVVAANASCQDGKVSEQSAVVLGDGDMEGLEEPMVVIDEDLGKDHSEAVDPLSFEQLPPPPPAAQPTPEYDSDSKDVDQHDVVMQKTGLVGVQLFRCAKCELFFSNSSQFKDHLIKSEACKYDSAQKPYKCYHCGKFMKHYTNLLDHLGYHGHRRFTCSLCNKKFAHANQARYHLKHQHNVLNVQMQPLVQHKTNLMSDSFIAKPLASVKQPAKEAAGGEGDAQKQGEVKTVYYSFEADQIPQKSILGYDITCGHCKKFKNKVRSNIVRHLLLHQNDKDFTVPDTAPVNPVPCLEKNEKMFDKMYNLASSSHTGGRMGGQQKGEAIKDKVKDTNYPAFVPTNKRYQCCAVGCNYLCLEEGNLRHHLTALHMEDLSFVCVHCKRDLSDAVDVDTIIKHLKLHDLHLYKCSSCDYMHSLRHKIERHIGEEHKNRETTVVVVRAMDAEPFDENQQQQFAPVVVSQKAQKPWRCCMCKYRCQTEDEVVNHVKNKHNIDCRYKCALCAFKTNGVDEFKGHYASDHAGCEIDVISAYHKDDEASGAVSEGEFDTTPLWLRDKPRVRHIRGILFEEDTTTKKKPPQVKQQAADQSAKDAPNATAVANKKRKRSMSVAGEPPKNDEEIVEPKKEVVEPPKKTPQISDEVIVIEDDDDQEAAAAGAAEEATDVDLMCTYGDFGMPLNKHFKCPKCEKYRTTKMRDFVQHVTGELRYYRFTCTICNERFVTLENIQMHCIDYHDCSFKSAVHLPVDEKINRWLTLLLKEQRSIITGLGFACEEVPEQIEDFLGSLETASTSSKSIKCKECGFSVSGPTALGRHMMYNHPEVSFKSAGVQQQQDQQRPPAEKKRRADEVAGAAEPKRPKVAAVDKSNLLAKDVYVCNLCGTDFNSVPEMEYHGRLAHEGQIDYSVKTTEVPVGYGSVRNLFRCRYCSFKGTKPSVEGHIMGYHPGQKLDIYRFSCGLCPAKFEMMKSLRRHFKSHDQTNVHYYDVHDTRFEVYVPSVPVHRLKKYKCPVCDYSTQSVNSANIKQHLLIHARPFLCELCRMTFKTRPQARAHHAKEHPHNTELISTRQDMMDKITQMLGEVMMNVTKVEQSKVNDTYEDDVLSFIHPEVLLGTDQEQDVDVEIVETEDLSKKEAAKSSFARKSTGLNAKPDETKEYYSFYGQKAEPVDLKKIVTNFEVADARMKMSCDQLGTIYNLNPVVKVKDCMTMIIDDEEEVSS